LHSHEPTLIINNVVGLAKGAKAFKVPHVVPREVVERMERNRVAATGKATGAAIVAAAKRARMGGPEVPPPPPGSFAERVKAAAKKARRPTGSDE
jgi:hypothetical protein